MEPQRAAHRPCPYGHSTRTVRSPSTPAQRARRSPRCRPNEGGPPGITRRPLLPVLRRQLGDQSLRQDRGMHLRPQARPHQRHPRLTSDVCNVAHRLHSLRPLTKSPCRGDYDCDCVRQRQYAKCASVSQSRGGPAPALGIRQGFVGRGEWPFSALTGRAAAASARVAGEWLPPGSEARGRWSERRRRGLPGSHSAAATGEVVGGVGVPGAARIPCGSRGAGGRGRVSIVLPHGPCRRSLAAVRAACSAVCASDPLPPGQTPLVGATLSFRQNSDRAPTDSALPLRAGQNHDPDL